ncbi:caspase-8-like isoform X2 [Scyliorhinus canicula]|uniref:caspase-8-like isoform X2 n=1 Tax=Scyliorhinus canicula TaxID=7830 RepID=UPI0018F67A8A|nr:caspase-8-like isoform X2 [Scyliorhinus canicula]
MYQRLKGKMALEVQILYKISEELDEEEVRDLRFLCSDFIPAGKTTATVLDLFTELQQQELNIIPELLYQIQRFKLLSTLGIQKADVEQFLHQKGNSKISNYRVLIYTLSKEIDDGELNSITFILQEGKRKCRDIQNFMDLCIDLEKKEQLGPNNVQILLQAMKEIKRVDLKSKLETYQKIYSVTIPQQESRRESKEPNQRMLSAVSCTAQADAKLIASTGTESHQEPQQVPSTADDPAVERPHLQQAGGSTIENTANGMANLHSGMKAMSMESTSENSTTSSSDAAPALPPCHSAQASSNLEANQHNKQHIEQYKMNSEPLGICLILNNKLFPGTKFKERNGTNCDAERLTQVFTTLGFEVHKKENLTVLHMKKILQRYQKFDHTIYDCFVCCILSHGEKDAVVGTDGDILHIQEIRFMFSGTQCHSLLEKPKVFFIQACQGRKSQTACPVPDSFTSSSSDLDFDAVSCSIPEDRDFLIAMSTISDYVSYRTGKGSWFIQTLCACLEEFKGDDLLTILTEVNRRVSEKHSSLKQIPEPRFTLSKRLILSPPSAQHSNS